jgi:hypothetical protein
MKRTNTRIFNPRAPLFGVLLYGACLLITGLGSPLAFPADITLAFPSEAKREVFFLNEEPQGLPVGGQEYMAREITLSVPKGKEEGYILVVERSRGAVAFRRIPQVVPIWKVEDKDWRIAEVHVRVESEGQPVEFASVHLEVLPEKAEKARPILYERLAYRGEARFFGVIPGEATVTVRYLAHLNSEIPPVERTSRPQRFLLDFSEEPFQIVVALPKDAKVIQETIPLTQKEGSAKPPSPMGRWLLWLLGVMMAGSVVYFLYWWAVNRPDSLLALRQKGVNLAQSLGSALGKSGEPTVAEPGSPPAQPQPSPPPLVPEGHCPYCGEAFRPDGTCACTPKPASGSAGTSVGPQRVRLVGGQGSWSLPEGSSVVGREPGMATLVLPDPTVSRRHAEILNEGGRLILKDLGSRNGTFVNGLPVAGEVEIRIGDTVQFGGVRVRVELEA